MSCLFFGSGLRIDSGIWIHDNGGEKTLNYMNIGVFYPSYIPMSFKVYVDNILRELKNENINFIRFTEDKLLPQEADLYWDPCCGGTRPPLEIFKQAAKPFVATVHGLSCCGLLPWETYGTVDEAFREEFNKVKWIYKWKLFEKKCRAIITPSQDTKARIIKYLGFKNIKIIPIWHGVNEDIFMPAQKEEERKFLFHISAGDNPRKNLKRIIAAYNSLSDIDKPQFMLKITDRRCVKSYNGIEFNFSKLDEGQVASFYQQSLALIFPSLYEGFGFPIIEAMACGCPVITSKGGACEEVAGDAAILVNPRSVKEIRHAMEVIIADSKAREALCEKGLKRAKLFSWHKSAMEHLAVFKESARA
jgi:glycosyltransferase involved in cell wall biosynthesis